MVLLGMYVRYILIMYIDRFIELIFFENHLSNCWLIHCCKVRKKVNEKEMCNVSKQSTEKEYWWCISKRWCRNIQTNPNTNIAINNNQISLYRKIHIYANMVRYSNRFDFVAMPKTCGMGCYEILYCLLFVRFFFASYGFFASFFLI